MADAWYLLLLCFLEYFLLSSILSSVPYGLMILARTLRHQPPSVFWDPGGLTESQLHHKSTLVLGPGLRSSDHGSRGLVADKEAKDREENEEME